MDADDLKAGMPVTLKSRKAKDAARFQPITLTTDIVTLYDPMLPPDVFDLGAVGRNTALVVRSYNGVDYQQSADRPKPTPASPPRAKFKPAEIKAWAKLNDLCVKDERGATFTEWREVACKNAGMSPTAFKVAKGVLMEAGWVIGDAPGRGARFRTTQPGTEADAGEATNASE